MGTIPGYTAVVKRNGSPVDFVEAEFTRDADHVSPGWAIKLPYAINLLATDAWTIQRGYGGYTQTLISAETASNIRGEEALERTTKYIRGEGEANELLDYCVPKTFVFINPVWLADVEPNAELKDDIIKVVYDTSEERYYHPRLPQKEIDDDEFVCFLGPQSHHAIAQYLCGLIGYNFVCNTPDITLKKTYTIPVGTTWFDAIKQNFLIWGPNVTIRDSTIYILDMMPGAADIPGIQTVKVDNPAIVSINEDDRDVASNKTVDHVIIEGKVSNNTTIYSPQQLDFTIVEIPEIDLSEDEEAVYTEEISGFNSWKQFESYSGTFESGDDEFSVYGMPHRVHKEYYHVYYVGLAKNKKRKLVREIIESYRSDGVLKHRVTTNYRYGPGKRPIGSSSKEEGLVRYPGQSDLNFVTVKWHHIFENRFVRGVNRTLASELVEQLVLYELNDSGDKLSPITLEDANRLDKSRTLVEKDADTDQAVLEMTTNIRTQKIDRIDEETLIQRIFDYDVLADTLKITRQVLENPLKGQIQTETEEDIFRAEFHDGTGTMIGSYGPCYHPPINVKHEDIDNETLAEQIADRVFARKNERNVTITIKTPVPIPIETMSIRFQLSERAYKVDGSPVSIPGGYYYLRKIIERITSRGTEQTLTLRSKF